MGARMPEIFISHASADAASAQAICAALEQAGIGCWIAPRDIAPGLEWADAIVTGIAGAHALVVVHSAAAGASGMMRREVTIALERGVAVLPIRIDPTVPRDGMQFYLSSTHWLDAFAGGLDAHLPGVVAAVRALLTGGELPAPVVAGTLFVDRPAIAVLPFRAQGGADTRLADELADELIAAISVWREFPVIARQSTAAVPDGLDARAIGRRLGARYLVSGRVRSADGRLRVSVECVEAESGAVLLAETLDFATDDPLVMVDAVVMSVAAVLGPEVLRQERERASTRTPANPTARDMLWRGLWHRKQETREDVQEAERLFRAALEISPGYAPALCAIAMTLNFLAIRRWTDDVPAAFGASLSYARAALVADGRDPGSHFAVGVAEMNVGARAAAVAAFTEAVRINPSYASARANLAQVYNYLDRPEDALIEVQTALRLSPHAPYRYQWQPYIAASHYLAGRYRDCLVAAQEALQARPDYPLALRYLVAALGMLGRAEEAAPALAIMRRVDGDLARLEGMTNRLFVPSAAQRILEGFRRAGFD